MSRCPECGAAYSPDGGGHCRGGIYLGCCRTFATDDAADAHRVGPYEPKGLRRCLSEAELLEQGWRRKRNGWTPRPAMTEAGRAQLRPEARP